MTKTLCAVDDDPGIRQLIRVLLADDPRLHLSGEADNFHDALEIVSEQHPDLLVLDHMIHGEVMGLDAAPLFREASPRTAIILFTSNEISEEAVTASGVDLYLDKLKFDELLPAIQRLLDLH